MKIYRIEDKDGIGPFHRNYLPKDIHQILWDGIQDPFVDFGMIFEPSLLKEDYINLFKCFCEWKFNKPAHECLFGFPEGIIELFIGDRIKEIEDYISIYESDNWMLSYPFPQT